MTGQWVWWIALGVTFMGWVWFAVIVYRRRGRVPLRLVALLVLVLLFYAVLVFLGMQL